MTLEDIIIKTKERLARGTERPIMIMVAGGSATGKSSQVLPQLLSTFGDQALLIEQDMYQLGVNFSAKDSTPYKWDDPQNFQIQRFIADLTKLRNEQPIAVPSFTVIAGQSGDEQMIKPKPVIIVDGIYALYGGIEQLADFSVYVTLPLYARFLRRLFRALYEQEQYDPQVPFKHAFGSVLRAHQDLVSKQLVTADCVIELSYSFADTIKHYNLQPVKTIALVDTTLHFDYGNLQFLGKDEGENYHFYIIYNGKLYYDFLVNQTYKPLLNGLGYLSQ